MTESQEVEDINYGAVTGVLVIFGGFILFISFLGEHGVYTALYIIFSRFIALPWFEKGYVIGFGLILTALITGTIFEFFNGGSR